MSFGSTFGLGLRLAVGRGRAGITRLLLMSAGVAVGVALVVGGLGIAPAIDARHARGFARFPAFAGTSDGSFENAPRPDAYLLWIPGHDRIGEREVARYSIAKVGTAPAPLPPGVTRLPAEGEKVISPALAEMFETPLGRVAAKRFPGRMVGLIGPEGLLDPNELVAWIGVDRSSIPKGFGYEVIGFGEASGHRNDPIPIELRLLILIGVVSLLVPTLVFVVTSTRLSAASRERRLAAIRLVGATPAQARLMAAVESGVAAALGSVAGVGLFFALRPVVAGLSLAGYQWFPSDIAPPVAQVVAVVVAAPVLAVLATMAGLRRLIVSPLGVTRRARVRRAGPVRLVLPAIGLAGLVLCWLARDRISRGTPLGLTAVGVSFLAVLAGVAMMAPWLGGVAAPLLTRWSRGVGALMGARRLQADPTAAGRVVGAVALLVCAAGVVLALVPPTIDTGPYPDDLALGLRPGGVAVERGLPAKVGDISKELSGLPGVRSVAPIATFKDPVDPTGGGSVFGYTFADCAALKRILPTGFPRCGPQVAYVAGARVPGWLHPGVVRVPVRRGSVSVRIAEVVHTTGPRPPGQLSVILPTEAVPAKLRPRLVATETVVETDGSAVTVERIRNAMAGLGVQAVVRTPTDAHEDVTAQSRRITSLVDLGILTALGIALANLLVVTIDHVTERRRPVAVLAASGLPLGVLRRSIAVEIGLPLATAIALATVTAVIVATLLGGVIEERAVLPFGRMTALYGLAAAAVAVVTSLTFPSLARAARPETLQAE